MKDQARQNNEGQSLRGKVDLSGHLAKVWYGDRLVIRAFISAEETQDMNFDCDLLPDAVSSL